MKILYAIQGTGNGHLSRAMEIVPILLKNHEVDILISGTQAEVKFPFTVKYRFRGLGFIFGANGGIDLIETYKKNYIKDLFAEINSLCMDEYDLVINDFEPVSAWASYLRNASCISLSHQAAVMNKKSPKPKDIDVVGKAILKNYAPADATYGFHFKSYDDNIFTPVIRSQVRNQKIRNKGHYTVYLPSYNDKRILKVLRGCGDIKWEVFSKHNKKVFKDNNIIIQPIDNEAFITSMASSAGVICGAGFETPAEALYMKKKLMVIPMKGQYEQQCNAAALKKMGVPVLKNFKLSQSRKIKNWIESGPAIEVDYPDNTEEIVNSIIAIHSEKVKNNKLAEEKNYTVNRFRKMLLKKIVAQF
jgi:uncharacterized protein (TIGR00661 family)